VRGTFGDRNAVLHATGGPTQDFAGNLVFLQDKNPHDVVDQAGKAETAFLDLVKGDTMHHQSVFLTLCVLESVPVELLVKKQILHSAPEHAGVEGPILHVVRKCTVLPQEGVQRHPPPVGPAGPVLGSVDLDNHAQLGRHAIRLKHQRMLPRRLPRFAALPAWGFG
jgi:hypothetical protein